MKKRCKICGIELPAKGAECPVCGMEIVRCQDVSCGLVGEKNKVKFKKCDVILTDKKLFIQDVHDRSTAGMLGLVGAAIYSAQKKRFICEAPRQDLVKIEYPLKAKYGSMLDSVKGDAGMLLCLASGERYAVRPTFKKSLPETVQQIKEHGVIVE
ncbi:MAG: hypothetical protein IJM55_08115 [Ruminococcus sp.]|nr:hypothetical protein [Ruminococcus sp.]